VKNTKVRTVNCVKTNKGRSAWFGTRAGARQGGVVSPILFNIIMNVVCNEINGKIKALIYADGSMM
jgi:hypothetical protein